MVVSMTGYGRAGILRVGREMTVELKSVNHRFLDIAYRMPRNLSYLEDVARKALQETLQRGHVDVYVNYRNTREDARQVVLDENLAAAYVKALGTLRGLGLQDDMGASLLAQLPGALNVEQIEEDRAAVTELFQEALQAALTELRGMRGQEGGRIREDVLGKLSELADLVGRIQTRAPQVAQELLSRLRERIAELLSRAPDEARIVQEAAILAERAAIDEEIVRLHAHIAAMRALMEGPEAAGKKLDFLSQELNREMNTIGSKAGDLSLVHDVVQGKSLIEKVREQVQNIE